MRVSGHFTSEESLEAFSLRVSDKVFRLSDVVNIKREYADPPTKEGAAKASRLNRRKAPRRQQ